MGTTKPERPMVLDRWGHSFGSAERLVLGVGPVFSIKKSSPTPLNHILWTLDTQIQTNKTELSRRLP